MHWKKIRNVFNPQELRPWMHSHAANPVPYVLDRENEIVRVFFTTRNNQNESHIGYVDLDFVHDYQVIKVSDEPVLKPGQPGLFDDSGTAMGCLVEAFGKIHLFYLGWNLKVTVPWLNTIGRATAGTIDGPFEKAGRAPAMDRSEEDPFSISYPSVLSDNGIFRMWYGSNLSWGKDQSEMQHVIKYAESSDLLKWNRTNEVHIPLIHKNEYALSKPWVLKTKAGYKMWYSFRANNEVTTYRIGYAESPDGLKWTRRDEAVGISVSESGWDSEMICYPSVFELNGRLFMLYNGNGYGRTGFGLAVLEEAGNE